MDCFISKTSGCYFHSPLVEFTYFINLLQNPSGQLEQSKDVGTDFKDAVVGVGP